MEQYDLLIIGGGPGGYSVGVEAAKKGLKVALFEKEHLGGTCLNVGCIPTKYLVDKAIAMEKVRALVEDNIFQDAGNFSFFQIQNRKKEVTKKLVNGVRYLLKKSGAEVIEGNATLKENKVVECNGKKYVGESIVIATGSQPMLLPVPGCEHCIDSTGALEMSKLPKSMVIIGGGVIGLELACVYAAYGTQITVLEMMPDLLPNVQNEAARIAISGMKKLGIDFKMNAKLIRVEEDAGLLRAVYEVEGKEYNVVGEQVLMAAGRKSNLAGIKAEELGLKLDGKNYIVVDSRQRTNLSGIYAIGDVTGGYQLAHTAYAEGERALSDILGTNSSEEMQPVPVCIYSIPPIAFVGLNTEQAKSAGYEPVLGTFDYSANGMALATGASGSVFVVADKTSGKTLGITIVGENAAELIAFATSAVTDSLTTDEWEKIIVAHPSLCEMVREAALDAFGRAVHRG